MAGCERCWSEACRRAMLLGGAKVDHYHDILEERGEDLCSPEDQCGALHVLLDFKDGTRRCRCGKNTEESK